MASAMAEITQYGKKHLIFLVVHQVRKKLEEGVNEKKNHEN